MYVDPGPFDVHMTVFTAVTTNGYNAMVQVKSGTQRQFGQVEFIRKTKLSKTKISMNLNK